MDSLPPNVCASVQELVSATNKCTGFRLNVCLSYGGRAEIAQTCRSICVDVKEGRVEPNAVTENFISDRLLTRGVPGIVISYITRGVPGIVISYITGTKVAHSPLINDRKLYFISLRPDTIRRTTFVSTRQYSF